MFHILLNNCKMLPSKWEKHSLSFALWMLSSRSRFAQSKLLENALHFLIHYSDEDVANPNSDP